METLNLQTGTENDLGKRARAETGSLKTYARMPRNSHQDLPNNSDSQATIILRTKWEKKMISQVFSTPRR